MYLLVTNQQLTFIFTNTKLEFLDVKMQNHLVNYLNKGLIA